jgi:class III poly(R)-hydroxyalkanoic acid synthase PhaE subunit
MKDWQALQKQYWTAWTDATRGIKPEIPDPATPWHEGFEQWARLFGDAGKQNETLDRLMASAKGYSTLMQSMISAATGKPAGEGAAQVWTDALRNGFNVPGADAWLQNNPLAQMLRGIRGPGVQGFDQLSQTFAPFLAQARQEGMSWLNVPAFGYLREHQEHYQKMVTAFVEYQDATGKYNELILKASQRSFEIFQDKLAAREEPGRQIESPRALYDLWVDAAEEAYQEIALSDEFRKAYGDVVNAQMRVRSQIQQEVERIGVDLGMPTRTELNSVHKRLHELRRAGRNGTEKRIAELERELASLRSEVAALKRAPQPAHNVVAHPKQKTVKTAKAGK